MSRLQKRPFCIFVGQVGQVNQTVYFFASVKSFSIFKRNLRQSPAINEYLGISYGKFAVQTHGGVQTAKKKRVVLGASVL